MFDGPALLLKVTELTVVSVVPGVSFTSVLYTNSGPVAPVGPDGPDGPDAPVDPIGAP